MTETDAQLFPLLHWFYQWEKQKPDADFLRQPFGDRWEVLSYREAGQEIRRMATALKKWPPGAHIGIFSKNCMHWILCDLAISMAGHVSVPFFPTLNAEELRAVLQKGDVQALFVGKLDEWDSIAPGVPEAVPIIRFPHYPGNAEVSQGVGWEAFSADAEPVADDPMPALDSTWTILFTSGTTGSPKGVVHHHAAPARLAWNEMQHDDTGTASMDPARFFSFLPLNHVAERAAVEMMCLMRGGSISFAENLDTFIDNLKDTQPTLFFAVPRIWTKFQSAIFEKLPPKRLDLLLKIPVLSSLLKARIRNNLGLSKATSIFSAAAPMPDSLKLWYRKLGIDICDVYGMTETMGPITITPPGYSRLDTVGKAMGDAQVRIDEKSGEILLYAPWNMIEYYKDPDLTAKVLEDGWVHSGDKGELSPDGYLRIVGRVKDTFKSAKGEFIVPSPIEQRLKESELIEQVCVVGRGLAQPMALVTLTAAAQKIKADQLSERLEALLERINRDLHNYERLAHAVIVEEEWTPENSVLTPTLKVKRRVIEERYGPHFERWMAEGAVVLVE